MMRIECKIILAVLAMTMIGCGTVQESGESVTKDDVIVGEAESSKTDDGVIVVEVESFKLTKAKVQKLAEASGGETVVLQGDDSKAEKTVQLDKGTYYLTLYVQGASSEEDAAYMTVGDGYEERIYPDDVGSILPTQEVYHTQKADGPCTIVITFAEANVQLDRVEIKSTQ